MCNSENEDVEESLSLIASIYKYDSSLKCSEFINRADNYNVKWAYSGDTIRTKYLKISNPDILSKLEDN